MQSPTFLQALRVKDQRPYLWGGLLVWTLVVVALFLAEAWYFRAEAREFALAEARSSYNKDLVYRRWATLHGGVYVPVTDQTPPNPYLADIPERDLTTPSGRQLTLMNPAYMTRQVQAMGAEQYGLLGHITSLNPIRPENKPDEWEAEALRAFEAGAQEISSLEQVEGQTYLRFMHAMYVEEGCLKCHGKQGYTVGQVRGGISVSVPMAPWWGIANRNSLYAALGLGGLWVFGAVGLVLSAAAQGRRLLAQQHVEAELRTSEERYHSLFENSATPLWEEDFAAVKARLDHLRAEGVSDLRAYFANHPDEVKRCADLVEILNVNAESRRFFQASDTSEVMRRLPDYFVENSWAVFAEELAAMAEGGLRYDTEIPILDLRDEPRLVAVRLSVAPECRATWARVLISFNDITEQRRAEAALRRSEERLQQAIRIARLGIWDWDMATDQVQWFGEMFRMYGITAEAFSGKGEDYINFTHPAYRTAQRENIQRAFERGLTEAELLAGRTMASDPKELCLVRPDGTECYTLGDAIAIVNNDGTPLRMLGITLDITERVRAEAALRESEASYRALFEKNQAIKLVIDPETGALVDVNTAAVEFYGYSREQLLAMHITDLNTLPPAEVNAEMERAKTERRSYFNFRHRLANGMVREVEVYSGPVEMGGRTLLHSIIHDITERKQAEERLRQSEAALRQAQRVAHVGSWVWHIASNRLEWSDEMYHLFGLQKENFSGNLADVIGSAIHPEDRAAVERSNAAVARHGQPAPLEYRVVWPDGSVHWMWAEAGELTLDEAGQPARLSGIVQDITERKRAEADLKANEEKYRLLFENMTSGFALHEIICDESGRPVDYRFLEINPAFEKLTGLSARALLGQTVRTALPETEDYWIEKYGRVALTGQPLAYDNYSQALGRYYEVWAFSPRRGQFAVMFTDVTARKEAETERQMLLEITQGSVATNDLRDFLGLVQQSIAKVVYAENFFVLLYHKDTGLFEEVYSVDKYDSTSSSSAHLQKSISAYVFRTGRPLLPTQAQFDELVRQGEVELVGTNSPSWLGVPLKTASETIGVMALQHYDELDRYSQHDLDLLTSIAGQVALVITRKLTEEKLHKSEALFRAVVEHNHDGIILMNAERQLLYASPSYTRINGYLPDELIGTYGSDHIHPDDRAITVNVMRDVLQSPGAVATATYRIRHKIGHWLWVETTATNLLHDPDVQAIVLNSRDITERRRAEAALRESRDLLQSVFSGLNEAVMVVDTHTRRIHDCNAATETMFGYRREELVGQTTELLHVDAAHFSAFGQAVEHALTGHTVLERQFQMRRRSGEVFPTEHFVRSIDTGEGEAPMGISVVRDITARVRAEAKLRQLSQAVEQSPATILITDTSGAIQYANPAFTRTSGYALDEALGQNPRILKSGETPPEVYTQLWGALLAGGDWRGELHNRKKSGELYWEFAILSPIKTDAGRITHFLAVKEDITVRKQAEAELAATNARLEQAVWEANQLAIAAQAANRLKSEILANTSHELRTPLTGILGSLGLILEGLCDTREEERSFIVTAYQASRQLLELINNLLDLAKIEAGKMEVELQPVNLALALAEVETLARAQAQEKGLVLRLAATSERTAWAKADPDRVRQILLNVVNNALKFTEQGEVELAARADLRANVVRLTVRDTGIGVPLEQQAKLFQPFVQVDGTSTRRYGGTGLGLSLSRQFAELMNGSLTLESAGAGQGCMLTLTMPLASRPEGPPTP